jgi:methionyl-tRNA formyltransferase
MKQVVFIGNRPNVFEELVKLEGVRVIKAYVVKDSLLEKLLPELLDGKTIETRIFVSNDKQAVLEELAGLNFDILISNGCPLILPISQLKKDHELFINIHPTVLPNLKGKTPLSGVFMTHVPYIGATVHYMDDGIDTGNIIYQEKVEVTSDLDQGLVYRVSFDLERVAFRKAFQELAAHDFNVEGTKQELGGSYFNRTTQLQTIDMATDNTDTIIDKVKSFGIKGQGSSLTIGSRHYKIYAAEKIINSYLLSEYQTGMPGEIVVEYDDKFIIRAQDGLIKVTDYEVVE